METQTRIRARVEEYSYLAMFSTDPSREQPPYYRALIEEVTERPGKIPRIKRLAKGPERLHKAMAYRDLTKLRAQHNID